MTVRALAGLTMLNVAYALAGTMDWDPYGEPIPGSSVMLKDIWPTTDEVNAAVADGLGSKPLSHLGSQAACDAAMASLQAEAAWDRDALVRDVEAHIGTVHPDVRAVWRELLAAGR